MGISAQRASDWSAPGTKDAMSNTYKSVIAALSKSETLNSKTIETFLQGSYANATNIRGDSDVDIVVMLKSSWISDTQGLSFAEQQAYDRDHSNANYGADQLRHDVITALTNHYGAERVEPRNKSIRVHKKDGYVDADVVPAIQHRVYSHYSNLFNHRFIEGTKLFPKRGGTIVNYPKIHLANGHRKNQDTMNNFKPGVRQLKQLKRQAVNSNKLDPKLAPGYLLECMSFNAPQHIFTNDHHDRLHNLVGWLLNADLENFLSVDGIHKLFKTDPGNFSHITARNVMVGLASELHA